MKSQTYFVSREEIRKARVADLYSYLLKRHEEQFKREGQCLSMRTRKSLYIKRGIPGYNDFASGEHGNSVDYLVRYLHYSFIEAVIALNSPEGIDVTVPFPVLPAKESEALVFPEPSPVPYRRVHAYLRSRGLPGDLINRLIRDGTLYEDTPHGNAVFITPERDYCEIRGTLTYVNSPFHSCRKLKSNCFWYFSNVSEPKIAYICEATIDALSLFILFARSGSTEPAVFISIGGAANQQSIDRIKHRMSAILAVDNDDAGFACCSRNLDIPAIFPVLKDWNEDLQQGEKPDLWSPVPHQPCLF